MENWWLCKFCGHSEPADPPYGIGDKEPCSDCSQGTSYVMTLDEVMLFEAEIEEGLIDPKRSYTE